MIDRMKRAFALVLVVMMPVVAVACSADSDGDTITIADNSPTPTRGATRAVPSPTRGTETPTLTDTPRPFPTPAATITPFVFPTFPPTITPFVFPTVPAQPTSVLMGVIQTCLDRSRTAQPGLYIVSLAPSPALVWDTNPHVFRLGICNTSPPASAPGGDLRIFISFPGSDRGHADSDSVQVQLNSAYNEVTSGPWVPGLENHLSACATRPTAQVEVHWNAVPLLWLDGKSSVNLPIGCGGNFS